MRLHHDDPPEHLAADLEELLAEDPRVGEQGLRVTVRGDVVEIAGTVATEARRRAVGTVAAEHLRRHRVDNRVEVVRVEPPGEEQL